MPTSTGSGRNNFLIIFINLGGVKHAAFLLFLFILAGCGRSVPARHFPTESMRTGDLVFRCGRGVLSRAVVMAEQMDGRYSHVGVLIRDVDGVWKVAHSVPAEREFNGDFDRVKFEPLEAFLSPKMAARGCLVHVGSLTDPVRLQALCDEARQAFRDSVRFDHDYDLADSSKVYCTEFIWLLFKHYGLDLSEGRRRYVNLMNIRGDILLPEHILQYKDNTVYYQF